MKKWSSTNINYLHITWMFKIYNIYTYERTPVDSSEVTRGATCVKKMKFKKKIWIFWGQITN